VKRVFLRQQRVTTTSHKCSAPAEWEESWVVWPGIGERHLNPVFYLWTNEKDEVSEAINMNHSPKASHYLVEHMYNNLDMYLR
jgi:hypothetical protein